MIIRVRGLELSGAEASVAGLLEGKSAIIYGAGGFIGRGVARTFAHEGAAAFLASDRASGITAVIVSVTSGLAVH